MAKTVIEKVDSTSRDITVFKVGGTLGFHENETIKKFLEECSKRGISKLVLDFSSLESLGGGCAKIIREFASRGDVSVVIAGASRTVLKFLKTKGESAGLHFVPTVDEAVEIPGSLGKGPAGPKDLPEHKDTPSHECSPEDFPSGDGRSRPADRGNAPGKVGAEVEDQSVLKAGDRRGIDEAPKVIILGHSASEEKQKKRAAKDRNGVDNVEESSASASSSASARELKKKLIQYNTLFTISSDFNRIKERSKLLDIFLLTAIAQVGVESAAFFERTGDDCFRLKTSKGMDASSEGRDKLEESEVDIARWEKSRGIFELAGSPMQDGAKEKLSTLGFLFAAPFIIEGRLKGLVVLGKPIKKKLDDDAMDFLKILTNQAAIAYENTKLIEEESERTLGLVQTLISLIEENTVAKGNTDLVSNYTYALAKAANYPEELIKDLMFGTVLRDIGMIKVSDLIVRSPRELVREEWEIIKRHPLDGADMLRRMKFSEHAVNIVLCHHERFNGEGYPNNLEGHQIPLGARIVSVVESYGAMLRDRPNRPALTREEALNTLKENWGLRYDPDIVKMFVEIAEEEMSTGKGATYASGEVFKF